ncbi:peptidoglycan DD-transpeptidase MrdA [Candidatus Erwinia haradaeae]|uniref:Peptidoglycan D,D-transpeptidase MrdA n=1 Tax=Candidatus Erwinia haradaeae TaxID=1922217 RepID=A0A803GCC8_9GAMM|nr:peptidoglycan DD-transpeptidase MrdA [Candidatus Erwinia haradaeae]VFP87757.1 Peptidoglycan D,D-transpeptidase MrdA [Candidatus Erwinia haradaeae]
MKSNFFRDYTSEHQLFVRREFIAFLCVLLLSVILVSNLYLLQVIRYREYTTLSNANRIKLVPVAPRRGLICDRNGVLLACNRTIYQLEIVPEKVDNLSLTLSQLKPIFDLTHEDLNIFYKDKQRSRNFSSIVLKTNLTEVQIARFAVNQYKFNGVVIVGCQQRFYPYGSILTHVLGYVSRINHRDIKRLEKEGAWSNYAATHSIGKLGIERYYEDVLHGTSGYEEVEVNNRGRVIRQLYAKEPQAGCDIHLTIDLKLQKYITTLLVGSRAAVVVTDPSNGEVLAMVSTPSYNPNLFVQGMSNQKYSLLLNDEDHPLINRVIQGSYPPASTVKPYIAISALSVGVIARYTTLFDPGWWQLPGTDKRFRDWKHSGHGNLDIIKSIEESSDTFFYQIAYEMGINRLSEWMKKFGYGALTGIDLQEESPGIMPTREWKTTRFNSPWYPGDTISIGIGQGYWAATPIQMNKALMILINDGVIKIPHLLMEVVQGEHAVLWRNLSSNKMVYVDSEYWRIVKEGMYNVANQIHGTAYKHFADAPYQIAAKSGTAQVFGLKSTEIYNAARLTEHLRDHKIMTAYAPYTKPRIAVAIILENGGAGSEVGKITRKILDYIMFCHHQVKIPTSDSCRLDDEDQ